jgi:GT2 family glycosyltransferase
LRAIGFLSGQRLQAGVSLDVVAVDDGSVDGTSSEILRRFPSVRIVSGTGSLYWGGGMIAGWRAEIRDSCYDYLLVANDDVELFPESVQTLLDVARLAERDGCNAVAVAANLTDGSNTTYGALCRCSKLNPLAFRLLPAPSEPRLAHTLNMNCALISRAALDSIGFLSPVFRHTGGDYDFGLRLRKAGGQVWQAPGHQGYCKRNSLAGTSKDSSLTLLTRLRHLLGVKECPLHQRAVYAVRHAGVMAPVVFLSPYARLLTTALLDLKIYKTLIANVRKYLRSQ